MANSKQFYEYNVSYEMATVYAQDLHDQDADAASGVHANVHANAKPNLVAAVQGLGLKRLEKRELLVLNNTVSSGNDGVVKKCLVDQLPYAMKWFKKDVSVDFGHLLSKKDEVRRIAVAMASDAPREQKMDAESKGVSWSCLLCCALVHAC